MWARQSRSVARVTLEIVDLDSTNGQNGVLDSDIRAATPGLGPNVYGWPASRPVSVAGGERSRV